MSSWSLKIDVLVLEKCLAFCYVLVETNAEFSFNIPMGKDAFNFNNKELDKSFWNKNKKCLGQLRRKRRRKDDRKNQIKRLKKFLKSLTLENLSFTCDHCDASFKYNEGLKIHVGKAHKSEVISVPEKERGVSH